LWRWPGPALEDGKQVVADWWRLFENPKVDAFITQSMADNPTLQAAQATLRQSQDILRAGYGVFIHKSGVTSA